ncbi:hypothetical protein NLI96_g1860 [Meripilus lineatus]|uniref:phosphatidylserine decarboxylase n=1 Tax=Meripilus lineatus TaxID=2056292 RepID=A0AAD5VC35_9APHY|nr:hypothetical protein NLI96_g1860 [Physisporinus lineatus]
MSSIQQTQKPVEVIHPSNLPESADPKIVAKALDHLVNESTEHNHNVNHTIHAPLHKLKDLPDNVREKLKEYVPGLEKLANDYHIGNFVAMRSGERFFETMPIYPRLGMHLLFYGGTQVKILHNHTVESTLKDLSIRQGKAYDSPASVKSIPSFIHTYSIKLDELLEPDLATYKTFNDFFSRKLKPDARPVQNESDPAGFCSAADCRLVVYENISHATRLWIKGNKFTISHLLGLPEDAERIKAFEGGSVASFRLAPADYHRFHSPLDGTIDDILDVPGEYYTVNPQAVNEPGFDVFTENKRSILYMTHSRSGLPVAIVAIGAMLVGSIRWTGGYQRGTAIKRGEELGYFAYGGSTVIVLFPKGLIKFDDDLVTNSQVPIETLMKVGYSIGRSLIPPEI